MTPAERDGAVSVTSWGSEALQELRFSSSEGAIKGRGVAGVHDEDDRLPADVQDDDPERPVTRHSEMVTGRSAGASRARRKRSEGVAILADDRSVDLLALKPPTRTVTAGSTLVPTSVPVARSVSSFAGVAGPSGSRSGR